MRNPVIQPSICIYKERAETMRLYLSHPSRNIRKSPTGLDIAVWHGVNTPASVNVNDDHGGSNEVHEV